MKKKILHSKKWKEPSRELLVESLKLPKDSMLGAAIVTITGTSDAFIENYRGIIEYSDELILLQGKNCKINIQGTGLTIDYYTNEDMKISGRIHLISYL